MGQVDVVKLPPHMRPAGSFLNLALLIELLETSIGVGLQDAMEATQVLLRMFSTAIRRVAEPYRGCRLISRRSIIPNVGPEASCFGLALTRSQHRHRRFIGVQLACSHHITA